MAYTELTEMVTLVNQLTGVTGIDALVRRKLGDSAATDPNGTLTYRPYFVAAKVLQQDRTTQALDSAEGVKFTRMEPVIASLMAEQQSLDSSLQLEVPAGFAAIVDGDNPVMSVLSF